MNLLQSQDALKGENVAMLRARKSGQIPPTPDAPMWLVDAVLAEKIDRLKKEELAQGAAQGALPSITEQINQKAEGLMALQAKTQQAQQQMTQQMAQAPQPAPEGVPQPEPQPQPEPLMMAHGGLARLPVDSRMFDYREGGIIGFAESEDAVPESNEDKEKKQTEADRAAIAQLWKSIKGGSEYAGRAIADIASIIPRGLVGAYDTAVVRPMKAAGINASYLSPMLTPKGADADSATPFTDIARKRDAAATTQQGPNTTPEAGDMGARNRGLASLAPKPAPTAAPPAAPRAAPPRPPVAPQPPVAATPTAAPPVSPGLPSVAPPSDLQQLLMESLKKETPNRTVDQARDEYKAASPAILNEPAGLAQLARLKQQQDQYEEGKKSRPMENWMRGLASAARGGIGGFGTSYIETAEGNRAADAAQADYQNKVMTAVDAMRRGEATTEQKGILDDLKEARKTKAEDDRSRRTNITTAADSESLRRTQLEVNRLNRESQEKIAELDRAMRQAHYQNPIAASTEKERFIKEFMKTGLSYTAALSKVMETLGESKAAIAEGRITAAHAKLLAEDGMYVRAQQILLDPSKSASEKAKAQLTIDTKEKILGIPPKSSQPTMTPAQAAAMEKYGAK